MKKMKLTTLLTGIGALGLAWCLHTVSAGPAGIDELKSMTAQEATLQIGDDGPPGTYRDCLSTPGGSSCPASGNEGALCTVNANCTKVCADPSSDEYCGSSFGWWSDQCLSDAPFSCFGFNAYCEPTTGRCGQDPVQPPNGVCGDVDLCF